MNIDEIKLLIAKGESETLEFKKSTANLHSALKTVCGLLNGVGGVVLIGVTDGGKVLGQEISDSTKREIARNISQIEPTAQPKVNYIALDSDKKIIEITVKPGDHAPYTYDGRAYQRNQSTTERMSQHRYEQIIVERGQLNHSWEEHLTDQYNLNSNNKCNPNPTLS